MFFGRSIFAKQLLLYILIILLISGVISFFFFSTARQHLEDEVGRKLQYIARISAANTPFERLGLIRAGDEQSRMVLRLKEKLGQIEEAAGVENIFVFTPERISLLDLNPAVPIGTRYPLEQFAPAFLAQLEEGQSVSTQGYLREGGGIFISAYAPVQDLEGRLFAVVGVDGGAGELAIIEGLRLRLYWITFAAIALACLLALFFARSITSPVRQMAQTAEQLGAGQYEARAKVHARDEVGVLAQAINRMAEQVRARDTALKELSASVAHEIRNPLNSIRLLISLLDEELGAQKNSAQAGAIQTLRYEIGKLNRFVGEFLTYARPVALIRDRVSASSLISSVLDLASAEAGEKQIALKAEQDKDLGELRVDRLRLEQTLLNLVLNAIQACERGGQVTLSATPRAGGVELAVEDTGPGMAPEILSRVFEPFFTTKAEGTGLGLANARKIIEGHHGSISAENRPAGGARFVIRLPAEPPIAQEG